MKTTTEVGIEPVLIDTKEAARICGVARSTFLGWDAAGLCPRPIRLNGRVLWAVVDLRFWAQLGAPGREAFEAAKAEQGRSRDQAGKAVGVSGKTMDKAKKVREQGQT